MCSRIHGPPTSRAIRFASSASAKRRSRIRCLSSTRTMCRISPNTSPGRSVRSVSPPPRRERTTSPHGRWLQTCERLAPGADASSDGGEHAVERARYLGEVDCLDQQACVSDLPAIGAAQEAPQLTLDGPSSPRRLLLKGVERAEVAVVVDDGLDGGGAESADQLVLQVRDADVEAQPLHPRAGEGAAEAGPLEAAPEHVLLA